MADELVIEVEGLRKSYGTQTAVDGVQFCVERGEVFGLLGPNGAGKTTTIRMLAGSVRPDAGTIRIGGVDDPMRTEVRRRLGLAPQTIALYEDLSAEENLAFFGKLYGLRGARLAERVSWALELAGLTDRRKDRIGTFSGGMKRRINLACALVHEPEVVFLDEPTVGVDPQSRNFIFENIENLKAAGLTLIYTTHYMEEAQRLCDRVAIMDAGKILALDTVDKLIERHGGMAVILAELERPPTNPDALGGSLDGLTFRLDTPEPMRELARLAQVGITFTTLRVERPDLEVVFLTLTGRRLRDE